MTLLRPTTSVTSVPRPGPSQAFPDAYHAGDDLIAEGDKVVLRTTARATHRGRYEGIDPTGRSVEFTGLVVYRIQKSKIAESWGEIDFLRLIRELQTA